ncbi:hypothetical protein GCM10009677_52270 [Sphaerisporangium rubeum]|uniref:Single-strand DNA-binding protein n=1 Tax=Sphaerisporangium rubeum TaxID=321317 RepID=A0A7X0M687_9ACTN|nr:single-strand DNA-binding protein [Sphaerisporangium rubeum]
MHRNEVRLVGRVSKPPRTRDLPSGDSVLTWGMAVRRPQGHRSGKKSDGIACVTFDPQVAAEVARWSVNDIVSVEGALHHRYWPGSSAPASTYEVEVHHAEVFSAPPTAAPFSTPLPATTRPGTPSGESPAGERE